MFPSQPPLYLTFCAPSLFSSLHLTLHLSSLLVPPFFFSTLPSALLPSSHHFTLPSTSLPFWSLHFSSLHYLLRSFPLLITSPYPPPLFPSGPSIFLLYLTFCAPSLFSSLHLTLHLSSLLVPPFFFSTLPSALLPSSHHFTLPSTSLPLWSLHFLPLLSLSLSSVQAATSLMMKSLLHWRSLRSQKSWQRVGWPICWTVMYVTYHRKSFALTLTWFAMVG